MERDEKGSLARWPQEKMAEMLSRELEKVPNRGMGDCAVLSVMQGLQEEGLFKKGKDVSEDIMQLRKVAADHLQDMDFEESWYLAHLRKFMPEREKGGYEEMKK